MKTVNWALESKQLEPSPEHTWSADDTKLTRDWFGEKIIYGITMSNNFPPSNCRLAGSQVPVLYYCLCWLCTLGFVILKSSKPFLKQKSWAGTSAVLWVPVFPMASCALQQHCCSVWPVSVSSCMYALHVLEIGFTDMLGQRMWLNTSPC